MTMVFYSVNDLKAIQYMDQLNICLGKTLASCAWNAEGQMRNSGTNYFWKDIECDKIYIMENVNVKILELFIDSECMCCEWMHTCVCMFVLQANGTQLVA